MQNPVQEAQVAAKIGKLGEWLLAFLQKTEAGNADLLRFVEEKIADFRGPELIDFSQIKRTFGPENGMLYNESETDFRRRIDEIKMAIETGLTSAPLLAESTEKGFKLLDGNHTYEALKELGYEEYWVIFF